MTSPESYRDKEEGEGGIRPTHGKYDRQQKIVGARLQSRLEQQPQISKREPEGLLLQLKTHQMVDLKQCPHQCGRRERIGLQRRPDTSIANSDFVVTGSHHSISR